MDKLDGYRGIRPQGLRQKGEEPVADERKSQFARFVLGVEAEKLMAGVANTEEIGRVMAEIVVRCESRIREATAALLLVPDLNTPEAKLLHFDAAVAAGIITSLNNLIQEGRAAGLQLTDENEP